MTDRELMQMALEALDTCDEHEALQGHQQWFDKALVMQAVEALRAALAQPEQETVPLSDYKELSAICTRQEIRLMELEEAQPEQDPVAWHISGCEGECFACLIEREIKSSFGNQGLAYLQRHVTAPPQRERILCGCGDQIMPDDGAECGTCVTARNATQREWQGLTDEEEIECYRNATNHSEFARAIEAKLKEKNT